MRLAVISDIHSNLPALEAVLNHIDSIGVNSTVCLGDIVGYLSQPNECISLLRARGIPTVMGNHDWMVADPHTPIIGSERARRTIQWARSKISNDNRHYLKTLPITHSVNEAILLVHGSLVPEANFSRYLVSIADASKNFEVIQKASPTPRMILFGHTHIPEIFQLREGVVSRRPEEIVNLYSDGTYLINPGSVGLSRNGDPRASYAVLDTDASTVTIHRVEFDSQSVEALASIHRALRSSLPEDAITPHLRRLLNIGKKLLRSLGLSKML